jgi:hypothetical protein
MLKTILSVAIALMVTLATAAYQRITGPTHPKSVEFIFEGSSFKGKLIRSGTTGEDAWVEIKRNPENSAKMASALDLSPLSLEFRKYKYEETWTSHAFQTRGNTLAAPLPTLPPAGKYEYRIVTSKESGASTPLIENLIIRFKGAVPTTWLVPHIICMFSAMLVSNMIAMRLLFKMPVSFRWPLTAATLLAVGGMFFGAFVQKFAFGEYWTGFPYGTDLTDNKTLIALVGWVSALVVFPKFPKIGLWSAIVIMTLVFLIPHSLAGSERNFHTDTIGTAPLKQHKIDKDKNLP